jgi:hypothetical protein
MRKVFAPRNITSAIHGLTFHDSRFERTLLKSVETS